MLWRAAQCLGSLATGQPVGSGQSLSEFGQLLGRATESGLIHNWVLSDSVEPLLKKGRIGGGPVVESSRPANLIRPCLGFVLLFWFSGGVSLGNLIWPETHCIDQAGFELILGICLSLLGLKVCTVVLCSESVLKLKHPEG